MGTSPRLFPVNQLPAGYAGSLDHPAHPPPEPRPAATLILLRDGREEPETLLLKRSPRTRFIPGAYVFPGGRVDRADADPSLLARLSVSGPGGNQGRMGSDETGPAAPGKDPLLAYAFVAAALRETFEETGILLALPPWGYRTHPPSGKGRGAEARARLLAGSHSFHEVLSELDVHLDAGALEYVGHWITPEPEPRRYDTRFFATVVPRGCAAILDGQEMVESLWLTAREALARNRAGELPLVFPTLSTLETLADLGEIEAFLGHFRGRAIPRLLPRISRKDGGIEISVEDTGRPS